LFPADDGLSIFAYDVTEKRLKEQKKEEERKLLLDLYSIASDTECSSEERVEKALQYSREYLDVSIAFVTKFLMQNRRLLCQTTSRIMRLLSKTLLAQLESPTARVL